MQFVLTVFLPHCEMKICLIFISMNFVVFFLLAQVICIRVINSLRRIFTQFLSLSLLLQLTQKKTEVSSLPRPNIHLNKERSSGHHDADTQNASHKRCSPAL